MVLIVSLRVTEQTSAEDHGSYGVAWIVALLFFALGGVSVLCLISEALIAASVRRGQERPCGPTADHRIQ